MQVGALNFGLWLDLRRMLVVHDRFQGGDSEGDSGDIWARFEGDAERFGTVRSLLRCCMHT